MNRKIQIAASAALLLTALLFSACSTQRRAVRAPIREQGEQFLIDQLKAHELKFHRFACKFSVAYEADKKKTEFSGSMRVLHDSIIWISISPALNIEAMRFVLTPDSVKLLNRLNRTFLVRDFNYINKLLNKNLDFDMAQAFLLGNDFSLYENNTFKASVDNDQYKLSTSNRLRIRLNARRNDNNVSIPIQYIWLDPQSFKISKVVLQETDQENRRFVANYSNYEPVADQLFPMNAVFRIETETQKVEIRIEYSKISLEQEQNYPFRIPEGYEEIQELIPTNK